MPVYVSAGQAFRLNQAGQVEQFSHEAAAPYAWKLAHDVRPARWSSGVKGCYECHAAGTPLLEGRVTALGPAPEEKPLTQDMYHFTGYDKLKMDAWNASFRGRTAFKYFGFAATGVVGFPAVLPGGGSDRADRCVATQERLTWQELPHRIAWSRSMIVELSPLIAADLPWGAAFRRGLSLHADCPWR